MASLCNFPLKVSDLFCTNIWSLWFNLSTVFSIAWNKNLKNEDLGEGWLNLESNFADLEEVLPAETNLALWNWLVIIFHLSVSQWFPLQDPGPLVVTGIMKCLEMRSLDLRQLWLLLVSA